MKACTRSYACACARARMCTCLRALGARRYAATLCRLRLAAAPCTRGTACSRVAAVAACTDPAAQHSCKPSRGSSTCGTRATVRGVSRQEAAILDCESGGKEAAVLDCESGGKEAVPRARGASGRGQATDCAPMLDVLARRRTGGIRRGEEPLAEESCEGGYENVDRPDPGGSAVLAGDGQKVVRRGVSRTMP